MLRSIPESAGLPAARALAARAAKAGAPKTGALVSSEFSNLQPGYFVVFSGVYGSASAAQAARRLLAGRFPKSYVRHIVP